MDSRLNQINKLFYQELEDQPPKRKMRWLWLPFFIFFVCIFVFLNFPKSNAGSKTQVFIEAIQKTSNSLKAVAANLPTLFPSFDEPKNFLLLGVPGRGNDAPDLTDTILVAHLNPKPLEISLISIPRDLWVKVPQSDYFTKINTLYVLGKNSDSPEQGIDLLRQKIEQITGQKIDYYVLVDLSVVKKIIDEVGGLNILVKQDIYDPAFPGPNHSFQTFELKAGWRYLDGETASKYIRTRHSTQGDFDRVGRQQQVLWALKEKLAALNPTADLPSMISVVQDAWNNIKTNISLTELPSLWSLSKQISPNDIKTIMIDDNPQNGLLVPDQISVGGSQASILKPRTGIENYEEIQKFIEKNL